MKIKVIHLLRRVERIDRDLEELDRLMATIQEDRDYADRVRDSLTEETRRLRELRERILVQVVKDPPALAAPVAAVAPPPVAEVALASPPAPSREPEIIVPKKTARRSSPAPKPRTPAAAPAAEKTAGRKKEKPKSDAPFQFRYN